MELTADQERLVRAGARFADVSPEEFLGECVRMGFDAADGVEPKLTIEGSATDTGSPSVAEAVQSWELLKAQAQNRQDSVNGDTSESTGAPEQSSDQPDDADVATDRADAPVLTKVELAEAIGFTTQSGLARTIGRAMAAKLEALGVREVELDGVRAHEVAEVVQRSREHCKTLV